MIKLLLKHGADPEYLPKKVNLSKKYNSLLDMARFK